MLSQRRLLEKTLRCKKKHLELDDMNSKAAQGKILSLHTGPIKPDVVWLVACLRGRFVGVLVDCG
jgi:hypothetical protein